MKKLIQLAMMLLALTVPGYSTTYYMATGGSDSNNGSSPSLAFATLNHSFAQMIGCDTLIIEPGYYYDSAYMRTSNLAGNVSSSGCYTIMEAATPWTVTIDGSLLTTNLNSTLDITQNYIQVIGIKFAANPAAGLRQGTPGYTAVGTGVPVIVQADHVKLQQTAAFNSACYNNVAAYNVGPGATNVLVEDSHAWGCSRYKFLVYQSSNVILRRNVSRHDYHDITGWPGPIGAPIATASLVTISGTTMTVGGTITGVFTEGMLITGTGITGNSSLLSQINGTVGGAGQYQLSLSSTVSTAVPITGQNDSLGWARQCANFTTYDSTNVLTENNIALDSGDSNLDTGYIYGGVWSENNQAAEHDLKFEGNLFLNILGLGGISDYKQEGTHTSVNNSFWNVQGSNQSIGYEAGSGPLPTTSVTHMTAINPIYLATPTQGNFYGTGVEGGSPFTDYTSQTVSNNVFQGAQTAGVADYVNSDYNYFYQNIANYATTTYLGYVPVAGPNDVQGTNPQIKYLTREEPGTPVYGTASDGGNIGATILYEIGTTGTLWGDTGYDTVTSTSLWPFPNESTIKTDMASFSMTNPIAGGTISGARGFAETGTGLYGGPITLTSYVWEALGYPCPSTICPGGSGYALSAIASPSYGGTVSGAGSYSSGVAFTNTATAATGYSFANWASCPGTAIGNVCSGTMPSANSVSLANFSSGATYTLTTSAAGTGTGTLTCSPSGSGISSGTSYSCSATAGTGSTLTNLTDGCGGTVSGNTTSGTVTANCTVTATFTAGITLTSITVTPSTATIIVSGTQQFVATGHYSDGSSATITNTATWSSSNTPVATVGGSTGLATGVSAGSATITATLSGVNGTAGLTVNASSSTLGSSWQGLGIQGQAGIL
jgi:hypothetical protein